MLNDWRPTCSIEHLRVRALMLSRIRQFFAERLVLEVETPLLSHAVGTDPHLAFFTTEYNSPPLVNTLFLQTSPEFAMKRLLAAGSGSIFQICKAFRNNESGRFHNPEFSLLEWYRVGFNLSQLMDEITELITFVFKGVIDLQSVQRVTYQDIFQQYVGIDSLIFNYSEYESFAKANGYPEAVALCGLDHALWLDFLFSHCIQSNLGTQDLCLVHGYPACLSSLARLNPHDPRITERVEVFFKGIELGNGYYELCDPEEQNQRFDKEIRIRQQENLPIPVKDLRLLAALEAGLPDCAGMAIGLDRLLILLSQVSGISDVLSFSIHRA